jgi:galactokinase
VTSGTAGQVARELLADLSDRQPVGVWSAPGRVNLIGEHTDYNDGFVLPFAIDRRTHLAAAPRDDRRIRVASTFAGAPVEVDIDELDRLFPSAGALAVPEWAAYPLGVAWALRRAADAPAVSGLDLAISSDVPVGAGLSSSAAIEGATAAAMNDLWACGLDATALALVGRTAENDAVGAPTGIMDQMAAMLGRADAALFLDCRTLQSESVPLGFDAAGLGVLVIDTRVSHAHSTGGYGERRAACERAAAALGAAALRDVSLDQLQSASGALDVETSRRARHVVTENARVQDAVAAIRRGDMAALGRLLLASHASLRDDFEVSVPELDTAVESAMSAGALGARMTGGGFGGAAIALVSRDRAERVGEAVRAAFADAGFTAPHVFPVSAAAGARRDA